LAQARTLANLDDKLSIAKSDHSSFDYASVFKFYSIGKTAERTEQHNYRDKKYSCDRKI
jgi:hypothetical protein